MSDTRETQWEYEVLPFREFATLQEVRGDVVVKRAFNELGEQGWELINFTEVAVWFKRRKASEDGPQSVFED